ncbi:hypothetical protein FM106_28335 [Brachybacterium faecium]|nr:hypothetical protein FM106_28335 [Brachybacterium faecium]
MVDTTEGVHRPAVLESLGLGSAVLGLFRPPGPGSWPRRSTPS